MRSVDSRARDGRRRHQPELVLDQRGHRAAEHPRREVAQLAHRGGVEGAGLDPADVQGGQPAAQLAGGPGGERHREHLLGHVDAGVHAVGDAVGDGAGLARARTREDADRTGHGLGGRALLLVERGEHRLRAGLDVRASGRLRHRPPFAIWSELVGPILPARDDGPGKHPQGARVDLDTRRSHPAPQPLRFPSHPRRGWTCPARPWRIPPMTTDPRRRRDHVHHHVVRLLRAAEEADAARGHRLRRGRHRERRRRPPTWSCRPTGATAPCPRWCSPTAAR